MKYNFLETSTKMAKTNSWEATPRPKPMLKPKPNHALACQYRMQTYMTGHVTALQANHALQPNSVASSLGWKFLPPAGCNFLGGFYTYPQVLGYHFFVGSSRSVSLNLAT